MLPLRGWIPFVSVFAVSPLFQLGFHVRSCGFSKCVALTLLAFCYKKHFSRPELREAEEDISHLGDAEKQAPLIGTEAAAKMKLCLLASSSPHLRLLLDGRPNCPMFLLTL